MTALMTGMMMLDDMRGAQKADHARGMDSATAPRSKTDVPRAVLPEAAGKRRSGF